jgi:large subunit ribosomal protein L18
MATQKTMTRRRQRRAWRVRKAVRGSAVRPRISVHRTSKHVYAQIIDDESGRTLCASSSVALKLEKGGNVAAAKAVGEALGKQAVEMKIVAAGFDRGSYRYHGRVKALADAVRAAGVKF